MNFKEVAQQEARIEKFKAEGRDEYDVKKQVSSSPRPRRPPFFIRAPPVSNAPRANLCLPFQYEVLDECKMMIPHTQKRLETARKELEDMLVGLASAPAAVSPSRPLFQPAFSLTRTQENEADLASTEEFKEAKAMLEEVPVDTNN